MKRPVFIISGIVIVFILLAVWVYVLFFGTPKNINETFSNLNFNDTTDTTFVEETVPEDEESVVDVSSPDRLRQLTTRQVVGFQEVIGNASSSPKIYYMESGTGHVFSIDLKTGEEVRVSATTIASARQAAISPSGEFIMVQSGSGVNSKFTVGEINSETDEMTLSTITENMFSFSATTDNTFLYAVKTDNSVIGFEYFPTDSTVKKIFTLPFREATIEWGSEANDSHFIYPKTTRHLESFLYEVKKTEVTRTPIDGYGMSAEGNSSYVIHSDQQEGSYNSYIYTAETGESINFPLTVVPEKCAFSNNTKALAICGQTEILQTGTLPDTWYTGEISFSDTIWELDTQYLRTQLLVDTLKETGRKLDIINIQINESNSNIYFENKNDQTLWLYERIPAHFISE